MYNTCLGKINNLGPELTKCGYDSKNSDSRKGRIISKIFIQYDIEIIFPNFSRVTCLCIFIKFLQITIVETGFPNQILLALKQEKFQFVKEILV